MAAPNDWFPDRVHVVPGNHDVRWASLNSPDPSLQAKFAEIETAWSSYAPDLLPIAKYRHTPITREGCRVAIYSLNSCLGCGEWRTRLLPSTLPPELQDKLSPYMADVAYERLDTPAFREDDISAALNHHASLGSNVLPVFLAHHNILPQTRPRIAIYTEVINAGLVRSRFTQNGAPLVYCHGHIHDNPVEQLVPVCGEADDTLSIVTISAPLLTTGFNLISLHYSRAALPIGCAIQRYTLAPDGEVAAPDAPSRVPFYTPSRAMREKLVDDTTISLLQSMSPCEYVAFGHIRGNRSKDTTVELLQDAEWFGLVHILNRQRPPDNWQIARVYP